jgi:single-strand DNA-binding protein
VNSINTVVISGNLTRDPELKTTPSGTSVCSMRVAVNDSIKDQQTGEWKDRPNYLNVDVFKGHGEWCARTFSKGSGVVVSGRLRWREWDAPDGQKREFLSVVGDKVRELARAQSQAGWPHPDPAAAQAEAAFEKARQFVDEAQDDDIPF